MARKPDLADRRRYHHIREVRGKYRVVIEVCPEPRQQVQRSFPATTAGLREAVEWRDITLGAVAAGSYEHLVPPRPAGEEIPVRRTTAPATFVELAERFLASKVGEVRPGSIAGYRNALARARAHFGHRAAKDISTEDVLALRTALLTQPTRTGRVASHRTIVYTLLAVRLVFDYGVRTGELPVNPAASVKPPRKSLIKTRAATPPPTWTPAELRTFITHLREEPDAEARYADPRSGGWPKAAFLLSACGLRRGEVLGLCWDAVDFEEGTIRIEASRTRTGNKHGETDRDDAKSGNSRRTLRPDDLHPGVIAALLELRDLQDEHQRDNPAAYSNVESLVVVDALGQPIDPEFFRSRFRRLCQQGGVPVIGLHRIRHSLANLMHDHGVPPKRAADLLGHSIEVHLSRYITNTDEGTLEAGRVIGRALWSAAESEARSRSAVRSTPGKARS